MEMLCFPFKEMQGSWRLDTSLNSQALMCLSPSLGMKLIYSIFTVILILNTTVRSPVHPSHYREPKQDQRQAFNSDDSNIPSASTSPALSQPCWGCCTDPAMLG